MLDAKPETEKLVFPDILSTTSPIAFDPSMDKHNVAVRTSPCSVVPRLYGELTVPSPVAPLTTVTSPVAEKSIPGDFQTSLEPPPTTHK